MPNDTLSFYFGNVARNVGQCCSVSTPIATLSLFFGNVAGNNSGVGTWFIALKHKNIHHIRLPVP